MIKPTRRQALLAMSACALPLPARAAPAMDILGRSLAEAVNTGAVEPWVRTHVSKASQERHPLTQWTETFTRLREVSGGMTYERAVIGPGGARLLVRPKRRAVTRPLMLLMDREAPKQVWYLHALPMPLPYEGREISAPCSRAELRAAIEQRVLTAVKRDEFSGAVLVTAPDGEAVYEGAFGWADRERRERNTAAHRFHLGSADKSFTSVLVARLIDSGRLSLDTKVAQVLPHYPNKTAAQAITVRHLLTHSGGLGGLFDRTGYSPSKPISRVSDILPVFAAEPLEFEPGARAQYSNEGYVLLGAIIEAVTGRPYWEELRDHVYAPAGMTDSAHFLHASPTPRRAVAYRFPEEDILGLGARKPNREGPGLGYRGDSCGGGYSTAADMTRYLRALRAGKLMTPERAEQFTKVAEGGLWGYGMGFQHVKEGARTLRGHSGGGPGSGINMDAKVVWETGWTYAVLGNYDAPFAQVLAEDIGRMVAVQNG